MKSKSNRNAVEESVFIASAIMVLSLVLFLIYRCFTYNAAPAHLEVAYADVSDSINPNRYRIDITNTGGETAEDVRIVVSLKSGGGEQQSSELHIDYCPKMSEQQCYINFAGKHRVQDSLVVNVISYNAP